MRLPLILIGVGVGWFALYSASRSAKGATPPNTPPAPRPSPSPAPAPAPRPAPSPTPAPSPSPSPSPSPAPSPTEGIVQYPAAGKAALWKALGMTTVVVDPTDTNKASLGTQLSVDPASNATSWLIQKNDADGGEGRYILTHSDATTTNFYALTPSEFDAFKGAQNIMQWMLFLSPNEWRKVAADAGT